MGSRGLTSPPHLLPPPPPPRPLPNPQVTLPSTPPPLCHPRSRFLPLPLCGACPFVGYCGFFSINYLRKKNNGEKRRLYRAYTALYDENRGNYSVHKYRVITSIVI